MRRLALVAAALVFFLNPGFGCSPVDPDFQYGEADMKAAVEGTWVLTLGGEKGASKEEITLSVTQSSKDPSSGTQAQRRTGLIRSAAACDSHRTFVASANACAAISEMPLDVALESGPDSYKDARLSGNFRIGSLLFSRGSLDLSAGTLHVYADVAPDGSVISVIGNHTDGSTAPVVSLVRTSTSAN